MLEELFYIVVMDNYTENNHYYPQSLIKQFAYNPDAPTKKKRVYVEYKNNGNRELRNPKTLMREKNIYTQQLEDYYANTYDCNIRMFIERVKIGNRNTYSHLWNKDLHDCLYWLMFRQKCMKDIIIHTFKVNCLFYTIGCIPESIVSPLVTSGMHTVDKCDLIVSFHINETNKPFILPDMQIGKGHILVISPYIIAQFTQPTDNNINVHKCMVIEHDNIEAVNMINHILKTKHAKNYIISNNIETFDAINLVKST